MNEDQDVVHQQIIDSLAVASRHLSTAAEALARAVSAEFGASPQEMVLGSGPSKRALILSANAVQAAESSSSVAKMVHDLNAALRGGKG
ncbi:hypothetical protein ELH53_36645 [Rhizobium ruizarguesonis]|uniref:hypothetical protein n=1 Tax=Rhizobium ruizarguesonis TaxID=2081791 RepID=UPI001030D522|nr:hypothetical protein [Rhizobium ruizarguesonis]MBY5856136.1 hypothetical protein [Rhizobium leguminosarum]TBA74473.1 hypothetical protein ELH53_36645 [Rhizobium ruizarguesonis]